MHNQIKYQVFVLLLSFSLCAQNQYYLSSSTGNDNNNGSQTQPWKTLSKLSNTTLGPGDTVYFKKGDTFRGHYVVNGSGTEGNPITFKSYGSGNQPVISGSDHDDGGGDYREAILVENEDNMIFEDLEIQNHRTTSRSDVGDLVSFGIQVISSSAGTKNNFTFRDMTFKNVYGLSWVDPGDQDAFNAFEVSGLTFKSSWAGIINDVVVEDSYFTDLQRIGIHIKNTSSKTSDKRNTNIVVRRNEFFQTGGTCVLPIRTENCLIENNIFNQPGAKTNDKMIGRGSAVWNWYSINTIVQYNQAINAKGILDSHGIHVDHSNIDTFIQYNLMQDCEGGFVEILGGNQRAVYRFNISINDGWRVNPNWANSDHTIWLNDKIGGQSGHPSTDSYIYNNTIVINKSGNDAFDTAIDINGQNTRIFNNIFYTVNGSGIGNQQGNYNDPNLMMTNNLFFGNIRNNFKTFDTNRIEADPQFYDEDRADQYGFQISASSQAIDAGAAYAGDYAHPAIPVGASTIFANVGVYPTVDFFGNSLSGDSTPNIGASNAKNGEITLSNKSDLSTDMVYIQNPMISEKVVLFGVDKSYQYALVDVLGRTKQQGFLEASQNEIILDQILSSGVYLLKLENKANTLITKILVN
ncbi:MAG: hypothetical protein CMC82_01530 [Flavobacteriaceae bacterium]|nr:hypothetical protein [Flavobacteriaceae bacterium]|tara:strand:+ start:767 stop:2671 length:1905 start_codon:yes stop_codon:yes gene_type:complete